LFRDHLVADVSGGARSGDGRAYHPRVSVSGICSRRWTLDEDLAFYDRVGVGAIGVHLPKAGHDIEGAVARVRAAGLAVSSVVAAPSGRLDLPHLAAADAADRLRLSIDAAAALGGAPVYFPSGRAPSRTPVDDAYAPFAASLETAVAYAEARGVRLAVEQSSAAMHDLGFIHSLRDAFDAAVAAGIHVCVDLQHCWIERDLRSTFARHVERIALVQVSDHVVGDDLRVQRAALGDGDMPLEWLLGGLLEAGYAGFFELEIIGPRIESEGYEVTILRSIDWLSSRLTAWGVP
jgi:sugar phosphate isomerase/epimerase